MKKIYHQPECTSCEISLKLLQTVSGETGGEGVKPGEGGEIDYSRGYRWHNRLWDEDEDDWLLEP
ncbi:MAG: hypothetical protein IJT98_01855 [Prevotella sp.]|nr:hypothetical protein [Prevotella sp.]